MQLISIKCTFNDPPRDPLHIQAYIYSLRLGGSDISWEYCGGALCSQRPMRRQQKKKNGENGLSGLSTLSGLCVHPMGSTGGPTIICDPKKGNKACNCCEGKQASRASRRHREWGMGHGNEARLVRARQPNDWWLVNCLANAFVYLCVGTSSVSRGGRGWEGGEEGETLFCKHPWTSFAHWSRGLQRLPLTPERFHLRQGKAMQTQQ